MPCPQPLEIDSIYFAPKNSMSQYRHRFYVAYGVVQYGVRYGFSFLDVKTSTARIRALPYYGTW